MCYFKKITNPAKEENSKQNFKSHPSLFVFFLITFLSITFSFNNAYSFSGSGTGTGTSTATIDYVGAGISGTSRTVSISCENMGTGVTIFPGECTTNSTASDSNGNTESERASSCSGSGYLGISGSGMIVHVNEYCGTDENSFDACCESISSLPACACPAGTVPRPSGSKYRVDSSSNCISGCSGYLGVNSSVCMATVFNESAWQLCVIVTL